MSNSFARTESPWRSISGVNAGYIMEQYELYQESPDSVEPELASLFRTYGPPLPAPQQAAEVPAGNTEKVLAAVRLAESIRTYGHLAADIYPLNDHDRETRRLDLDAYGLSEQDLRDVPASLILGPESDARDGLEAIEQLKSFYTGKAAYEFSQVANEEERSWIQSKIESGAALPSLSADEKKELLNRITHVEGFEKFIHRTFVGQKRFSIEGLDTLVVLMDELVRQAGGFGAKNMMIGMAHRGRLNVLTHILHKPYEMMFADFAHVPNDSFLPEDGSLSLSKGWYGDVKYHMGASYQSPDGLKIKMAYNPSHLEVVSPIVTGKTRAAQEDTGQLGKPKQDTQKAFAVLVHGDAAFPGQGIVTETMNYSGVDAYKTGGSIHIIANNTIGFTTEQYDSRTTRYASDPAKGFEMPIIHVNADDPEAVVAVARLAFEYRQKFNKDILIDLIGYRRYGHNEMDEPLVTNPLMYHNVHSHPTVRELYGSRLADAGVLSADDVDKTDKEVLAEMQAAYDRVKESNLEEAKKGDIPQAVLAGFPETDTGVGEETLRKLNEDLLNWPEEFSPFKKLARILKRREEPFNGKGKIDWAHAETLAFGTILQEGNPIRMSGQDTQRGTFAHRHLVLHDENTGEELIPLHHIEGAEASFSVYNTPLTESAILGYEYGYNVENPEALVIWEAQYGDFANMAQVMFDNFISSARAKWGQKSGLVMLLPHAYEGQGPEHSSARLERHLQLAAENNWTVANLSSAANYFHILRRQAKMLGEESIRPLIIVTPKSLLRHPLVSSEPSELAEGQFQTVLENPTTGKDESKVERLLFASGKMAIDLAERTKDGEGFDKLHIIRIEQLYPFPEEKVKGILERFPKVKELAWVQEEPENMGSWSFAEPYLRELAGKKKVTYHGRIRRSSPAEGDGEAHKAEQERILDSALGKKK
ncbi:2-oxoglutarate dehydrogenase E1 component [Indiicoccus explosivorum]|uniref:2-oxoglutarate dehydrogenase E1 component n=1 Tax=Indiicoccus explosivorum TaxID=1917864 RepID=UPI000B44B8B9|nr:2-oxoglutarate dehydrogenase E1 component [Indiicoccus explosivorum]